MTNQIPKNTVLEINSLTIEGSAPVVIIGPNGSGKSRLGGKIVERNPKSERISAKRTVLPPDKIQFQSEQQIRQEYNQAKNRSKNSIYEYSTEFGSLVFKLFAEDATSAISFRDNVKGGRTDAIPDSTIFQTVQELWAKIFPGRKIFINQGNVSVQATHIEAQVQTYSARHMSDGELVAFYLIARILDAEPGIIVIDEPELHLHSLLSRTLWDALEDHRIDLRFVYITHDLTFAESRRGASYIVVRPGRQPELVPDRAQLPEDIFQFLLGAASSSVKSNRIIFCEGEAGGIDERIYRAWVNDINISVVPVGGCSQVIQCFDIVRNGKLLPDLIPTAVIDRDEKPNDEIEHLKTKGIKISKFSEIEALLCSKEVFVSVCKVLRIDDYEQKYSDFLREALNIVKPSMNARILLRSKKSVEWRLHAILHDIKQDSDLGVVRQNFNEKVNMIPATINPAETFEAEKNFLEHAIRQKNESILECFPGKSLLFKAAEILEVRIDLYVQLVCKILLSRKTDSELFTIQEFLRTALSEHLF